MKFERKLSLSGCENEFTINLNNINKTINNSINNI